MRLSLIITPSRMTVWLIVGIIALTSCGKEVNALNAQPDNINDIIVHCNNDDLEQLIVDLEDQVSALKDYSPTNTPNVVEVPVIKYIEVVKEVTVEKIVYQDVITYLLKEEIKVKCNQQSDDSLADNKNSECELPYSYSDIIVIPKNKHCIEDQTYFIDNGYLTTIDKCNGEFKVEIITEFRGEI